MAPDYVAPVQAGRCQVPGIGDGADRQAMSKLIERLVELEADVHYQEPATEEESEFGYRTGSVPILVSAPHGAVHRRAGKDKEEDEFTAGIAQLVAENSGAHAIWLRRKSDEDPNNDVPSRYKERLRDGLTEHGIRFVLDLHGARATRKFGIALGTSDGRSCTPGIQDAIVETLREQGFVLQGQNLTGLLVNPRGFRANGEGTITRYVSRHGLAQAAQMSSTPTCRSRSDGRMQALRSNSRAETQRSLRKRFSH